MKTLFNTFLLLLFFDLSREENSPTVPLTNSQTAIYCHNQKEIGMMNIRCSSNEKIRMLDAFDIVVKNKAHLPSICSTGKHQSINDYQNSFNHADCKVPTSFTSACSGRENCTVHMQQIRLNNDQHQCHNELVDYTIAFYECVSDAFIHDICSTQSITSNWGTLQTPNFPNPYTSNDDCWCKLSTQVQHRLFLSVIVFQLIPYDQRCAGAGLYLQSSNDQRNTQCTYLQQGFSYLTDTNTLYMNFYSRISTVRGGFWIIYEANHANAEIHLHCGSKEKIGVPSSSTLFVSSPSLLPSFNKGWNRQGFITPTRKMISSTSPSSRLLSHSNAKQNYSSMDGAFTYPYGNLATYELAQGPSGWFLKFPSDGPTLPTIVTTTESPVIKWNSTWRYVRRLPTRRFTTRLTTKTTRKTTMSPTTTMMTMTTRKNPFVNQRILIEQKSPPNISEIKTLAKNLLDTAVTSETSTVPPATPWYPPAGPFDWWQWQWYATKYKKVSLKILTTADSTMMTMIPSTTTTSTGSTTTTTTTTTTIPMTTTTTTTTKTTSTTSTTTTITITTTMTTMTKTTTTNFITNKTSSSVKTEATADWFKWPETVSVPSDQTRLEDFDDYYQDSIDSSQTNSIPIQETNIHGIDNFVTKPQRPFVASRILTINPVPMQPFTNVRNDVTTSVDMQSIIDRVINQKAKKTTDETEILSQTDMTIVIISILFIVLLAIVNLILFAVRRHRHRLRSRHLLSSSFPSLNSDRRPPVSISHQSMCDSTNHLIDPTTNNNNNNNDILPAVGEIVLWDEKDQGGYMIDNDGEWAKVEGHQWFRRHISKNGIKASFKKSFSSRFRLTRHFDKKLHTHRKISEPIPSVQPLSKLSRANDPLALSPVPENEDCPTSMISTSALNSRTSFRDKIRLSLRKAQRKNCDEESSYGTMPFQDQGEYSMVDGETDRSLANDLHGGGSVIVRVPTLFRRDEDTGTITDAGESIYNQNYTSPSSNEKTLIPINTTTDASIAKFVSHALKPSVTTIKTNGSFIVGHCQAKFQPLDPKLLMKPMKKAITFDQNEFEHCSQTFQASSYDSGFIDDSNIESIATTSTGIVCPESDSNCVTEKHRSTKRHVSFQGLDDTLKKPESLSNLFESYDQSGSTMGTTSSSAFSLLQKQITTNSAESNVEKETPLTDEMKKRQILMNQVLDSLKKKKVYFQSHADPSKPIEPSSSFIIPPPQAYQSPAARRYSRRFRSSSASSNTCNSTDHSIIQIYPINDRQSYNTTQHHLHNPVNSTDECNSQVTKTSNKQNLPLTELYTYPHSEHSIAETRF